MLTQEQDGVLGFTMASPYRMFHLTIMLLHGLKELFLLIPEDTHFVVEERKLSCLALTIYQQRVPSGACA